jgi:hypothetical protein
MSTTQLLPFPRFRAFDANGLPLAGGLLNTYAAGTTTPLATYTNQGGTTANVNPVVLDSSGYADVWLSNSSYKFVLTDSLSNVLWTVDNVAASNLTSIILSTTQSVMQAQYQRVVGSSAQVASGLATDTTIASAITAATAGGMPILILAGTYAENVLINKQLSVIGTGAPCIINGTVTLAVGASYCNLKGFFTSQSITLNSGTVGNYISEVFLASGKTFIDNGVSNFVSGIQET